LNKRNLKVSVTKLADFSCRTGNLELSGNTGPSAREGMRAHKRIQSQRQAESECRLTTKLMVDDIQVNLSGRVDLLDEQTPRISEIKTTLVPVERVSESQLSLQWAQAKLYGYIYLLKQQDNNDLLARDGIELELIHANLRAENEHSRVQHFSFEELEGFALDALQNYVDWQKLLWQVQEQTRQSAAAMEFPYQPYRTGQRDMAAAVFRGTRDGESLLCEAPTGTGKTLSSLFPVVKAIGEGYVKHAVYLTAKTSGRQSAMQAVRALESAGLKITSVMIRSKAPTCFCSNGRCERDDKNVCPMTLGFFDRLPAAREEAITSGVLDGSALDEIAWEHQLCPFEFALQMLPWVSFVVADFNYVFDPLVRIARFSESRADTALLIDEAHNLVDRARGMHSGYLDRQELLDAHKLVVASHPVLADRIKRLCNSLLRESKFLESQINVSDTVSKKWVTDASEVVAAYTDALEAGPAMPEALFDTFKMACRFIAISELFGEHHKVITERDVERRVTNVSVNLKCLDASDFLKPQYKLFRSTVVFSATLRPAPFYRDALGLAESTRQLVLGSPFSAQQVMHCVVSHINTRYQHRSNSLTELIELLNILVSNKPGNYMVFFPSYAYLEQAHVLFTKKYPLIDTWQQTRETDIEDRERLLQALNNSGTRLGFAILGGVFGEGIDYVGDKLIGVVLVGVGLPGLGVEQDLIADCYRAQGLDGFDYAYRYPGFTKVLQTAGRVIRTESDRGVVLLVDDRFNQAFYRNLYPAHWATQSVYTLLDVQRLLMEFWDKHEEFVLN